MVLATIEGALAGLVDGLFCVAAFEVDEALEDAWGLFGLVDGDVDGPALSGVSEVFLHLVDPMGGGAMGRCGVGASGAKDSGVVARFEFEVAYDGFHVGVVDADEASVPADPELVADVFGWDFVVGTVEFDVAVTMDGALGFLEVVKGTAG